MQDVRILDIDFGLDIGYWIWIGYWILILDRILDIKTCYCFVTEKIAAPAEFTPTPKVPFIIFEFVEYFPAKE